MPRGKPLESFDVGPDRLDGPTFGPLVEGERGDGDLEVAGFEILLLAMPLTVHIRLQAGRGC